MKKYIKPSVEIINVETQSILAESGVEEMSIYSGTKTNAVYSRRHRNNDIWDDDDWD